MRSRSLTVVLAAALAVLVFASSAFAQDDNPRGNDPGGDDPKGVYDGVYVYDDNPPPTGDDVVATPTAAATPTQSATSTASAAPSAASTPTASATPSATVTSSVSASPRADARALPSSGGVPVPSVAVGMLFVGAGIVAAMLVRRTP
jgi:hypothetical protein